MLKKVLVMEDEEILRTLIHKKLQKEGYEVLVAEDGEEGLRLLKEHKPDLVLLDIVMPKFGGFEVMERMAQDPELQAIPIIIISNSGQPVELDRAKQMGVVDWLIKTEFDPQEVVDKVARQISK